jgi:hypothetical protein
MLLTQLSANATAAGTAAGTAAFGPLLVQQMAAKTPNPAGAAPVIGAAVQKAAASGASQQLIVGAAIQAAIGAGADPSLATPAVYGPIVAKITADAQAAGAKAGADYATAHGPENVPLMAKAGAELAALVKTQIIGKGANYVVVNNLPDVSISPSAKSKDANTQALIKAMAQAFNASLKAGLAGESKVLYVDLFTLSDDQAVNPGPYGLTNVTTPACGPNAFANSSMGCNQTNLISGDVSHYLFADDVHPTPYEHSLIARYVAEQMVVKGWL